MSRLFVAVWPPEPLVDRLRVLDRPPRQGLRWTTEDQWHVTLRFLGDVAPDAADALEHRLAEMAASTGPVTAHAGPQPRKLGRGVWVLPVGGLEAVAAASEACAGIGEPLEGRRFHGHLTLARAKTPAALVGLPAPAIDETWSVTAVTLVRSTLGPGGARYEAIGRWPLRGEGSRDGPGGR